MTSPSPTHCSHRLLVFTAVGLLIGSAQVRGAENPCGHATVTVAELQRMDFCELDQLFAHGTAEAFPVGATRGTILIRTDGKRKRFARTVWKGKYFYADGCITNQWLGFRAISTHVSSGASWYDGKPCVVIEYPPGTAVFGNARDELREIAPGLFLGRFYERCPCPKLQGYFVLELQHCGS
jgi:hypothetical protein